MRQFVEITAENLPLGDGIDLWCLFPAEQARDSPASAVREILSAVRVVEERLLRQAPRLTWARLECELPQGARIPHESTEEHPPVIRGRLVLGARGRPASTSPRDALALVFSVEVALHWAVSWAELRGSEVLVRASNLPTEPGRLVCLSESSSGQRLSPAAIANSTHLTCPIQSASGLVSFRLRDLATGVSSATFTLGLASRPVLLTIAPLELYLHADGDGQWPTLRVEGQALTPGCTCEIEGGGSLFTRFVSSSELECSVASPRSLSALASPDSDPLSWSLRVRCQNLGWVSQSVAVWPRHGPQLLAASRAEVTQQSYLDGARLLQLIGRRLTPGLTCVQRAAGAPGLEYEYPLTLEGAQQTRAECPVAHLLFESAPMDGLRVELFLRGEHVVPSVLTLTLFPRAVLSLGASPGHFYKETPGLSVELRSSLPVTPGPQLRLACNF